MARESRRERLDQPLRASRRPRSPFDQEYFGRLSERISRFLGSWRFIAYMTAFVLLWLGWNTFGPKELRYDPWQFIGLTLLLSLQASYAAPLILLAQNRQADRDRVQYLEDRQRIDRILDDQDYLTREVAAMRSALGDVATRDFLRDQLRELRELLDELDERDLEDRSDDDKADKRTKKDKRAKREAPGAPEEPSST
jgi:uncharacterized membrane protein